jgi:arylsulfatase A-like enzyme
MQPKQLLCSLSFLLFINAVNAAREHTNVILFLVDDMGWMDSSTYGSKYYETPNMDRLAKQSMRFTDAYAVPLCSPTRATILSGQYSARHGVTSASGHQPPQPEGASLMPDKAAPNKKFIYPQSKNYLDLKLTTIAEVLKQSGYRTGHFGKWHLGATPRYWPDQHGFETTWFCTPDPGPPSYFSPYGVTKARVTEQEARKHIEPVIDLLRKKYRTDPAKFQEESLKAYRDGMKRLTDRRRSGGQTKIGNITDGPDGEYITDRLTNEALKFIEKHQGEPFYLNLCQYAVHGPWGHKEEYTKDFVKKKDPRGKQRNPIMASMLKSMDQSLGRILDRLDQLGLTQNTLFIFYSDNGGNTHSNIPGSRQMQVGPKHPKYASMQDWKKWAGDQPPTNNDPLREGKGRIYEGGQRVPLMVRWPGHIKPATTTGSIVTAVDIYPTILDALDLPKPKNHILDGLSFLPVLEQRGTLERQAIFTWFPHLIPAASVRAGDFKLIRRWETHPKYPDLLELYNLKDDISETANLATKMPGKVRELEALIDNFIKDTDALAPKPNPAYESRAVSTNPDPTTGLVPKMSKIALIGGALRVEADGRTPFLGTAQVRIAGPLTLKLRIRGNGGQSRIVWKMADQEDFPQQGQSASYTLARSDSWQDVKIDLPIAGTPRIVRIYVPTDSGAVDIQTIEFSNRTGKAKRWEFRAEGSDAKESQ